jgi:RNA polymerase sigma-70 factor, ECF subfamily
MLAAPTEDRVTSVTKEWSFRPEALAPPPTESWLRAAAARSSLCAIEEPASPGSSILNREPTIMCADDPDVTLLLRAMRDGDKSAAEKLLPLVYNELHRLAKSYMQHERADHTLQPTALINEAYLRLAREEVDWQNRQHFIGFAAKVMRHLLVDHARAHNAQMRAGDLERVEFEEGFMISDERSKEVIALHDALVHLEEVDPRQAKVVELRYFGGFSVEEIGELLEMSPRSVKRHWALARIWLLKQMEKPPDS